MNLRAPGIVNAALAVWGVYVAIVLGNETTSLATPSFYFYGTVSWVLLAVSLPLLVVSALSFRNKRFVLPIGAGLSLVILLIAVVLVGPPGDPFSDPAAALAFPPITMALCVLAFLADTITLVRGRMPQDATTMKRS